MTDEQCLKLRRELSVLMGASHRKIGQAASLIKHKASIAPLSAEAAAFKLLSEATADLERWIVQAGIDEGVFRDRPSARMAMAAVTGSGIAGNGEAVPGRI